jgi:hypothetical protein
VLLLLLLLFGVFRSPFHRTLKILTEMEFFTLPKHKNSWLPADGKQRKNGEKEERKLTSVKIYVAQKYTRKKKVPGFIHFFI